MDVCLYKWMYASEIPCMYIYDVVYVMYVTSSYACMSNHHMHVCHIIICMYVTSSYARSVCSCANPSLEMARREAIYAYAYVCMVFFLFFAHVYMHGNREALSALMSAYTHTHTHTRAHTHTHAHPHTHTGARRAGTDRGPHWWSNFAFYYHLPRCLGFRV